MPYSSSPHEFTVELSERCKTDLDAIADYLVGLGRSLEATLAYIEKIQVKLVKLGRFPYMGRPGTDPGLFEWPLVNPPYYAVYTIAPDQALVEIVTLKPDKTRQSPRT